MARLSACASETMSRLWPCYPAQHVIVYPVRVPPFHGVHLHTIELQAEVQMIATGEASGPAMADHLPLLHHVSRIDADMAQVAVNRLQSVAVVNHHAVAVDAQFLRIHDLPVV